MDIVLEEVVHLSQPFASRPHAIPESAGQDAEDRLNAVSPASVRIPASGIASHPAAPGRFVSKRTADFNSQVLKTSEPVVNRATQP